MALATVMTLSSAADASNLTWQPWSSTLFEKAKAEHRLVILDLEAVWCHWCHVMADETYGNEAVAKVLAENFITVRVDQDANPDLSNRYGDWGWPATIIFASDGTELAKLRGFVPPARMSSLLNAFVADPTPGPSAAADEAIEPASNALLNEIQKSALRARFLKTYDRAHGGWEGLNKFVDADSMNYSLLLAENGDPQAGLMVKQTLDAARALIDPVWGGVYQYSETADWRTPHYEKIMWYQASLLTAYARAFALWHRPSDLAAAKSISGYLARFMTAQSGAFFTSQDADVDHELPGKAFYALDADKRSALRRAPRIDRHVYARENGWAIGALVAYANATGDSDALDRALVAARAVMASRRLPNGGYRHGEADRAGPYLADTLAMGASSLALYASTGDRQWIEEARSAGTFVIATFQDASAGFRTSAASESDVSTLRNPVRVVDEQIAAVRFLNLLGQYTGDQKFRAAAEHALRYVAAPAFVDSGRSMPGLLLADWELSHEPSHATIVGHKDDPLARTLNETARALPVGYTRIDWWDKREGALANPDVTYPELETAAAFMCTNRICSLPAFSREELVETYQRLHKPATPSAAGRN